MKSKDILCDSGAFISLTTSCLDPILYFLTEKFKVRFIIPPNVEYETVKRPLQAGLKQHSFSAIKIKKAIEDGIITKVDIGAEYQMQRVMRSANSMFYVKGKPLQLIQSGEAEMIALARELGIHDILIDERTTRLLIEAPISVREHLAEEFGINVMLDKKALSEFSALTQGMTAIRSSELVMMAYENGFFDHFDELKNEALEAALYKIKFSGCSLRFDEIDEYLRMVRWKPKRQ